MQTRFKQISTILFGLLLLNSAYLAAFATPSIFYMANVLLHIAGGLVAVGLFAWTIRTQRAAVALLVGGALVGLYLVRVGNTLDQRAVLWAHIAVAVAGVLAIGRRYQVTAVALAALPLGAFLWQRAFPNEADRIRNPRTVALSMEEEGDVKSPFWPSAIRTNLEKGTGKIPASFFMESKQCGECHKDIYEQWNSSMHHFASFNNQFYRKSIEDMQEKQGSTKGSRWCAGCHDHAVIFSGKWETPIKDQVKTPEAQTGLGCVSCHSIAQVHNGSVGNGGFEMEYPEIHDLAASQNKYIRWLDHFLTYAEPEPHRRSFMKPFMRQDSAEYCATCHKVHLDVPVNNYRWLRGFNDYDNWQASGVSGQGARSFYYPEKSSTCSDCHMPLVKSQDPGNRKGMVHSHRFAAANTAVAAANGDQKQLDETLRFLKSGWISVDIFAASPATETPKETLMQRRAEAPPQLNSTMAVGEEGELSTPVYTREVGELSAPINAAGTSVKPGSTVRLDVVVRTKKIGHFFPGGTVDAFDIWLELQGKDADGRVVFWSGKADENTPVEKGAHFYRSYMLDGEGNHINKRNAWQARSVLYVRLIPPGAADVAHYRVKVPANAKGPITFTAKLNYRKFAHFYTGYAYEGQGPAPKVPIVTLASSVAALKVAAATAWSPVVKKEDRARWNDWGIGLLLQGDLRGAQYAFKKVTEADPGYADGWLNVARALIQEGETEAAKPFLAKALAIDSTLARIHFFQAMVYKADGEYDAALRSLDRVLAAYPRDRVALNQAARLRFLKRQYAEAIAMGERCLQVDPEDLQAHYTLMLAYRGAGNAAAAAREEKLFRRFKADESAQAITAKPRLLNPEDNNERQPIHEHDSAPLD